MKRRSRWIVLCLVLQAHPAAGQQTGGRFGGSNWGAPPAAAPAAPSYAPPPMPASSAPAPAPVAVPLPARPSTPLPSEPPAPRVRVTNYRRPQAEGIALPTASRTRPFDNAEYQLTHPTQDFNVRHGPARTLPGAVAGAVAFGLGAALTFWLTREGATAHRPQGPTRAPVPMRHPGVEVRRISIAFDWTARASIQHALSEASARVDTSTPQGLHASAEIARNALAAAHRAARYGVFQSWALDPEKGQEVFGRVADSLRGRYTVESIDNARRVAAPKLAARSEEGPGLVVVSLLVAARGALPPLPPAMNLPALMAALEGMIPPRAENLAALEAVWSPADEGDPMSSAELEVLYPELVRLDEGAALGRRVCGSCHGVYAGELGRCPACGGV